MTKMSIIYHSKSGNTRRMAEVMAEGVKRVPGVEPRCFSIDDVDADWLKESSCWIIGSPTYYASISGELKMFLEDLKKYNPAGKLGGAFATANFVHGGGELAMQSILDHLMVYGMMAYSGGGACGLPVIHIGPEAVAGHLEDYDETFRIYGQRMAEKTAELFG